VAQVAAGDGLTPAQQERIDTALATARRENGLDISVLVGDLALDDLSQFRAAAERLHAALGERSRSAVLIVVAPGQRRVEIVTGPGVRRRVPDRVCALALLSMTTAFSGGDLAGGILDGVRQIADAAGRRQSLSPADDKRLEIARRPDTVVGSGSAPASGAGALH
jgi:uncharacterized membrane protein YgcG